MDKSQIVSWKSVAYKAQDVICQIEANATEQRLNAVVKGVKKKLQDIEAAEIQKLNDKYGISIVEYVDILSGCFVAGNVNTSKAKKYCEAILKIVIDMAYGSLKNDEFYKEIAEGDKSYV